MAVQNFVSKSKNSSHHRVTYGKYGLMSSATSSTQITPLFDRCHSLHLLPLKHRILYKGAFCLDWVPPTHPTPQTDNMASSPACVSTFPETRRFAKTMWLLGCVLEAIGYGILLPLALTFFQALRKRKGGNARVKRGLIAYILVSAALATAVEVSDLVKTFYAVLDETCVDPYMHLPHPYLGPRDILSFMTTLLTDGLLVSCQCR